MKTFSLIFQAEDYYLTHHMAQAELGNGPGVCILGPKQERNRGSCQCCSALILPTGPSRVLPGKSHLRLLHCLNASNHLPITHFVSQGLKKMTEISSQPLRKILLERVNCHNYSSALQTSSLGAQETSRFSGGCSPTHTAGL